MIARHDKLRAAVPGRMRFIDLGDFYFVVKRYWHHDRIDEMIAVVPFSDDSQSEIDFCRRSNLHAPLGNIAVIGLLSFAP